MSLDFSLTKTAVVVIAVAALGSFDLLQRIRHRPTHLLFACVFGSVVTLGMLRVTQVLLSPGFQENPHVIALGILLVVLAWRALFGPWETETRAAVLGTFLFWVTLSKLSKADGEEHLAHAIAIVTGLIPAVIWCMLFLKYHSERLSVVLLMFFSGMLSTVPILFYDALVRRSIELQFFIFRIVPESFNRTSEVFVSGQLSGLSGIGSTIFITLLSFVIVGVIEEASKYWVLRRSGDRIFRSIDDVMELSIIVAIGFAFAENISGAGYFLHFVRENLLRPEQADIAGFLSNVLGRSVLTSMVHIVSTGILGYFVGLAIFATPLLAESARSGARHPVTSLLHTLLRLPAESVYRTEMILTGLVAAMLLHGAFNFLVTLPDLLPGNPRTFGDVLGSSSGSFFHSVALILVPALFYVVGGFWILTGLFLRKENMKERGHVVMREVLVEGD